MQRDVEHVLARLFTDREFRERFLRDPEIVGEENGLSPSECRALAAMPPRDLRTAARSYEHKRSGTFARRGGSLLARMLAAIGVRYPALSRRIASSRSNR